MLDILTADIILTVIAIVWLIAASVTDIKKREVADWISYSLIAIALATKIMVSVLSSDFSYLYYSLIGLGIFFGLAMALYYSRIFGGGDAKLLMALGACFAVKPVFAKVMSFGFIYNEPFLLTLIINMLFIGAIYGIVFSIINGLRNKKGFSRTYKENSKKNYKIFYFALAIILFVFALITKTYNLIILAVIFAVLPYIFTAVKSSEQLMIKLKSGKDLSEGDWLAKPIKIKNKNLKITADGLSKEDIKLITKSKKKVYIKDGIPFVPAILVALIISLFVGNILLLLIA
ncbi:MAG: prepilin peptidase [archaeon]|nr:MAG: prepilin peptidase [archaeon]